MACQKILDRVGCGLKKKIHIVLLDNLKLK